MQLLILVLVVAVAHHLQEAQPQVVTAVLVEEVLALVTLVVLVVQVIHHP